MIDFMTLKPEELIYEGDWSGEVLTRRYKCTVADRGHTWVICASVEGMPDLYMYEIKRGLQDLFYTELEALADSKDKKEYAKNHWGWK